MRIFIAVLLGLGLQDDVSKGWKSPWAGAAVGSRLKWKITEEGAGQKATRERIEVVKEADAESVTVEEQVGEEKNDEQHSLPLPTELEGPWKKTGDEEIKVGDKAFKCAVYESKKSELGFDQTTRVWKSPDAPHWAVKATFSHAQAGQELVGWTEELLRIEEKVVAAGKELKCRVIRKTARSAGTEVIDTTWWTDDLPGRAARKHRETKVGGLTGATVTHELVEVGKK